MEGGERIREAAELKERMLEKITGYEEEIEFLRRSIGMLDSILKQSSFAKASSLDQKEETVHDNGDQPPRESAVTDSTGDITPIIRGSDGYVMANARIDGDIIAILPECDIYYDTPPFQTFFMDSVIGDMKKRDAAEVEDGALQADSAITCEVEKDGSAIRRITIRNYRHRQRIKEILDTLGWALSQMLEKAK